MKILLVHPHYLRPGEAGGTRFNDFVARWREGGHDVRVVASSVSYTSGQRGPWLDRFREKQVRRSLTIAHPGGGKRARLASMAGFAVSGTVSALMHPLWRPDVVLASSPMLTAAIPGLFGASAFGVPFVFEVRDLWPESAVTTGVVPRDSPLVRAAQGLEEAACELADHIVALTPGIRDDLVRRGLVEEARTSVIPNGVDLGRTSDQGREELRRELGWSEHFIALYCGAHGIANDLGQVLDAAEHLGKRRDVRFVLVGDGPARSALRSEARRRRLDNVSFLDAVDPDRAFELVRAADAGLVVLQDNPTFRTVYPNKMFDAMAAELPVVTNVDGVARVLVQREEAGVFVPPNDGESLARAVAGLAADPVLCLRLGWNGRQLVEERFDRRTHAAEYLQLLERLVDRGASR